LLEKMYAQAFLLCLLALSQADLYLHFPRGSNNRLDDGGRDRNNGGRLFDSQNNNRGGDNRGSGQEYYYSGSILPMMWTLSNGCGNEELHCDIIMQYSCQEMHRDGYWDWNTWTNTIPFWEQEDCDPYFNWIWRQDKPDNNCTFDFRYGMHESYFSYQDCRRRQRNRGLFVGSKDFKQRPSATNTRQNPDAWRYGYECPEEKDYYPYWAPSEWRDFAILTDTPTRCDAFKAESQNVKSRWICQMPEAYFNSRQWWEAGYVPIDNETCVNPLARIPKETVKYSGNQAINIGQWVEVPAHNIPAPYCGPVPGRMRVNQLGNIDGSGYPFYWNWTIPELTDVSSLAAERCVIRIRYNVTNVELPNFGWENETSVGPGLDFRASAAQDGLPTELPIWEKYNLTREDSSDAFNPVTANAGWFGRGYVYGPYPNVDIFGSLLSRGSSKPIYLQLAIDPMVTGLVAQDRTHTFSIRPLPHPDLKNNYTIWNVGVAGKRGNIVQTFPGTEYDFIPDRFEVQTGDLIHIQWNGADTNPRGNAGEGPAGFDRHNMLLMRRANHDEPGMELPNNYTDWGHWGGSYGESLDFKRLLDFSWQEAWQLSIPALNSAYNDFGIRQVTAPANTVYHYLCTRNNNFSNRSQKGKMIVFPRALDDPVRLLAQEVLATTQSLLDIGWAKINLPYNERQTNLQQIRLEDAGHSSYATHWLKITPRFFSVADKGFFQLQIRHPWVPFTYGRIFWAERPGDEPHEVKTVPDPWSWNGDGYARANINMGGYFVVENTLNGSAVGGIFIAFVGIIVLSVLAYRRFGCRCWNKSTDEGKENLLTTGAINSSSPATTAPPVTTTA